jgi:ribosomal protein S18 acetylase RimI-like enzyme
MAFLIPAAGKGECGMAGIAISPIGHLELPRVKALAYAIWPEAYAGILPAANIGPMLDNIYALETLAADIDERGHRYWLARVDGTDAGFVSAYREGDRVWIKKVYVLASMRGLSLGKRLIDEAVAAYPGARSVALFVNDGNSNAIGFYRAQGFAVEATLPVNMGGFDYTDYVMAKALP